jgi:hypothetical protein
MPIMAAHAQTDARGAAWLLASIARQSLAEPRQSSSAQSALNNAYRLLEAYRTNVIFLPARPSSRAEAENPELLTLTPTTDGHLEEVRDALDQAFTATFSDQNKLAALGLIERVLRAVAYPESFTPAVPEERAKVEQFFEELVQRLRVG